MKSSSRWLYLFGIAIGILVIVTVVLALTTGSSSDGPLLPENTPEGTIQRYLVAIRDGDYTAAESYLTFPDVDDKDLNVLRPNYRATEGPGWKATLGDTTINGDEATVEVFVDVFRVRGPFENSVNTQRVNFLLEREEGVWKITSPVNIYWIY